MLTGQYKTAMELVRAQMKNLENALVEAQNGAAPKRFVYVMDELDNVRDALAKIDDLANGDDYRLSKKGVQL